MTARRWLALFALGVVVGGVSCRHAPAGGAPSNTVVPSWPRYVIDFSNTPVKLEREPARIVSLAPSNTELVYAVGADPHLVADTTACDYPPAARSKPHIGGYKTDIEAVLAMRPDLVLAVGAVNAAAIRALRRLHVTVAVVDPTSMDDLYRAIRMVGFLCGRDAAGTAAAIALRTRIQAVSALVASARPTPRVLMVYGTAPVYTTGPGTLIDSAIRAAGGINAVEHAVPGDRLSPEEVMALKPDVIICSSELTAAIDHVPGWKDGVPAVRRQRYFTGPASDLLVRPGPRIADGIEALARYLHPTLFAAGSPRMPAR